MSTTNQDWFFEKTSDVLFVDEYAQAVGILNSNPSYTLDVNGTINTSNLLAINTITDYIEGSNATIDFINCMRLQATSNVSASNLISHSNLKLLDTWVSEQCPKPNQGSLFGFSLGGGVIDPSWLKVDNDWQEALNSLWNAAQTGYDLFTLARSIFDDQGKLANELKDALDEALDEGELKVPWKALTSIPFVANSTTKDLGVKGDLYLADAQTLYGLPSDNFTTVGDNGNMYLSSTSGREKILDIGTREAWLKTITSSNIITSNMTITSNLEVTKVNTNELIGGNVTVVSQLRVGEFYVNSSGLFLGDPANPFLSKQVLNAQGDYVGTIPKSQITDLEGFSMNALTDGTLFWNGYGSTTNPLLNDPFALSTPLFNVG